MRQPVFIRYWLYIPKNELPVRIGIVPQWTSCSDILYKCANHYHLHLFFMLVQHIRD